ncbi:PilZ domain-containing protein [Aneurinibacillus sp. Ricciae_BoGa-3]|uniref:PilZ domain-containing protein n=1 Tax=Aneurinibacillus sp. Ricciae_BoGa-3 TaxID=3022697 RepID=UPI00233FEA54|nr:PilZ domain-containing protein [Aneurinibacillus sp. Ricciae_BoGa-3]WCK54706.1 PilZ domain-containing protein [Aneurinibacillus sp. Ricciae_BoGa-3]
MSDNPTNKRHFFRLQLKEPLDAEMSIVQIKDQRIESKETLVKVDNISGGGLKYFSDLKMPVSHEIVLEFKMELNKEPLTLMGYNVWRVDREEGDYEYGVLFTIDEVLREQLTALVNKTAIIYKKKYVQTV